MRSPEKFDYILWTAVEGAQKHYWVKVKRTGEICEVDYEVMRYLRNEELKIIREAAKAANGQSLMLSYDAVPCEYEDSVWLQDPLDLENCVLTKIAKNEFCKLLTDKQLSVFEECMLGGKNYTEYAKEHQISEPTVVKHICLIRSKANIFFGMAIK